MSAASPDLLNQILPLLGVPWTPEANCWEFVRRVVKAFKGGELPVHPAAALKAGGWQVVEKPVHLCICALARSKGVSSHAGIYFEVDGGVMLHCMQPVSVITPLRDFARLGFSKPKFYIYDCCLTYPESV